MKTLKKIPVYFLTLAICLTILVGLSNFSVSAAATEPFNYTSSVYYSKLAEDCAEYAMLAYDEIGVKS